MRECFLAKGLSVTNSLGKRPLHHQSNSFFSFFSLYSSDNVLRDGILTKLFAPSRHHWSVASSRGRVAPLRAYPLPIPSVRGRWTIKRTASVTFFTKYARESFLRGGSLTKLLVPSRQGIIGQWVPVEEVFPREGLIRYQLPR